MEDNLELYTHKCLDTDYSYYLVINSDVSMYRKGINPQIDAILSDFREKIDKISKIQLFIKGNRLFFTYQNVKYYVTLSCWAGEWDYIDEVMQVLSKAANVEEVAYKCGELD